MLSFVIKMCVCYGHPEFFLKNLVYFCFHQLAPLVRDVRVDDLSEQVSQPFLGPDVEPA